ncbi:MAG: hypothetical protein K2K56_02290 [Lachnospiraceae bacterium]|nr:hypothetical protein [Lachnospiraceae bacterium]
MMKGLMTRKAMPVGKILIMLLLLGAVTLAPSVSAEAKWVKTGKYYRYTTNAEGTEYYRNQWVKIDGRYYYFNKKGYRKTGWLTYNGKKYYLDKNGIRVTGMKTIKNKKYYFTKKGVMVTGWLKYRNNYYYANSKGVLQTGLRAIGNYVYYFDSDGVRVTNVHISFGNMAYYFSNNGTLQYTGSEEEKAVKYINVRRMLKRLDPLTYYSDSNLAYAASRRAWELSMQTSHTRPGGANYSTVLTNDYPMSVYWSGECILWGGRRSGTETAANWLANSNANVLLQNGANGIGVAAYTDASGHQYWVAIVVQTK